MLISYLSYSEKKLLISSMKEQKQLGNFETI